jgi:hypothetical protein
MVWSWLLELPPVRREVKVAVDLVMDATEDAQTRQRERHRAELARAEERLAELSRKVERLSAAEAELLGVNASLRGEVAELEEAAQREVAAREEFAQRLQREQEAALAQRWEGFATDVFCCQSCWSLWFLSTAPDRRGCAVRGPVGRHDEECTVCADPLVALPAAKSVVFRKHAEDRVSRPADDDPEAGAAPQLEAIAAGLARLPKVTSRTIAWLAADLGGPPELPAKVLGEIATRTTMPVPLDGMVAGIRAFLEVRAQHQPG